MTTRTFLHALNINEKNTRKEGVENSTIRRVTCLSCEKTSKEKKRWIRISLDLEGNTKKMSVFPRNLQ